MKFNLIDMNNFPRKETYEYYSKYHCSYSVTVDLDISRLVDKIKEQKRKFYPTVIAIVTKAINMIPEFRMAVDDEGRLGYYDYSVPSYIIFHDDVKCFSCCNSDYNEDIDIMYKSIIDDIAKFANDKRRYVKPNVPNAVYLSCSPWITYKALDINCDCIDNGYIPMITWGKYDVNYKMPFTLQIDHAVADGYHSSLLINTVQQLCDNYS